MDISNKKAHRLFVAHILGISYEQVFFSDDSIVLSDQDSAVLNKYMDDFYSGKPISKIINKRSFWLDDFYVDENVLDPRQDSECLIDAVLAVVDKFDNLKILDIGTGSGCLIISILKELKNACGVATDISLDALNVAKKNAKSIVGLDRIKFIHSNFADSINEKFDIIVSNPPYIRTKDIKFLDISVRDYDPIIALDGGLDGLDAYRAISKQAVDLLEKNGKIFVEIGLGQHEEVCEIFRYFTHKMTFKDINGVNRVLFFEKK